MVAPDHRHVPRPGPECPLSRAVTANLLVRRSLFDELEGFDATLPSGGDYDFGSVPSSEGPPRLRAARRRQSSDAGRSQGVPAQGLVHESVVGCEESPRWRGRPTERRAHVRPGARSVAPARRPPLSSGANDQAPERRPLKACAASISLAYGGSTSRPCAGSTVASTRMGFCGPRKYWEPGAYPAGCPDHLDVPFAFKPYCFAAAEAGGLRCVLWLDATCVAIRPLDPSFRPDRALAAMSCSEPARLHGSVNGRATSPSPLYGLDREYGHGASGGERGRDRPRPGPPRSPPSSSRGGVAPPTTCTPFRGAERSVQLSSTIIVAAKLNHGTRCSADPRVKGHRYDQTVAGSHALT